MDSCLDSARRYMAAAAAITAALPEKPLYYIETFGCQQNEADSERIAGMNEAMGYEKTGDADKASLIIFNTCAVREHAELKALSLTGQLKHKKAANPKLIVGICGCMVAQEHRMNELKDRYPYVDFLFGAKSPERYPEILYNALTSHKREFYPDISENITEGLPVRRESYFKAWLSVMYGCDNYCAYCVVPYVRGHERSRDFDAVVADARELIGSGAKELTLLGQNVNSYKYGFARLLSEIDKIPGDYIVRFMTSHPKDATPELIDTMAAGTHIARHFHLPLQAGSDKVLAAMNRRYTREKYLSLVGYMREKMPDIALSSDIIVGFPGETEADFAETLDMLERVRFDFIYSFIFSPRRGTPAYSMEGQVPDEVKSERFARLLETQNRISYEKNQAFVGKTVRALVEGRSKNDPAMFTGRTERCRLVHFPDGDDSLTGGFAELEITSADTYTLRGRLARKPEAEEGRK